MMFLIFAALLTSHVHKEMKKTLVFTSPDVVGFLGSAKIKNTVRLESILEGM